MIAIVAASSPSGGTVIYILGAALVGGLVPTLASAYRRWRRGPLEDDELVARTMRDDVAGVKDLLAEYRIEVELNKRQLEDYRKQLLEITRELSKAQVKIALLEDELKTARDSREGMLRRLEELRVERDHLDGERGRLAGEAASLRGRVERLEQFSRAVDPAHAIQRPD